MKRRRRRRISKKNRRRGEGEGEKEGEEKEKKKKNICRDWKFGTPSGSSNDSPNSQFSNNQSWPKLQTVQYNCRHLCYVLYSVYTDYRHRSSYLSVPLSK